MAKFTQGNHKDWIVRHKGSFSEVIKERDDVIWKQYKSLRSMRRYHCLQAICKDIVYLHQSRHYISYERGCHLFYCWFSKGCLPARNKWKNKLYVSFIKRCEEVKSTHPEYQKKDIVWMALYSEAETLGLGPSQVYKVLRGKGAK